MRFPHSYIEYLELTRNYKTDNFKDKSPASFNDTDVFSRYFNFSSEVMPAYLFDYSRGGYPFANKKMSSITGQPSSFFIDGGVDYTMSIWHKEDFKIFSEKILIDNLKFLKSIERGKQSEYLISYNYRIKNKKGEYVNILQQSVFIHSSVTGMPLVSLGILTDISNYANDGKMVHTISKISSNTINSLCEPIIKKVYYSCEKNLEITQREIEVLKWLCEGLNSAAIADKLSRSVHTINNHRRNMLEKTNTKNLTELLRYASRNGIL